MRDDFNKETIRIIGDRVNHRCSNPECRRQVRGPHTNSSKSINIGVAAHITAASPGGPRYDPSLSSEQRKSVENGIWLCQGCAKLIDNDELRYPKELLQEWKKSAEQAALIEIEKPFLKNIYASQEIDSVFLAKAQKKFNELQLEAIPEVNCLPENSRIPFRHNPLFVGREDELRKIATTFKQNNPPVVVAITGGGGVGKTQLASEFVHRYGQYFIGGVFWLNFSETQNIPLEIANCGSFYSSDLVPNFNELSLNSQVKTIQTLWQNNLPHLLVFDNCEEEGLLAKWQPSTGSSSLLITSRRSEWSQTLGVTTISLTTLQIDESVALLSKYRSDIASDDQNLKAIAIELGNLPLALHLAGSYLARYKRITTPTSYLNQLLKLNLFEHPSLKFENSNVSPTGYEYNVARTFTISIKKLSRKSQIDAIAIKLLTRASYFLPDEAIPHQLLVKSLDRYIPFDLKHKYRSLFYFQLIGIKVKLTKHLKRIKKNDGTKTEDALTRLTELGLLIPGENKTFQIHRLLAKFVKQIIFDKEAQIGAWFAVLQVAQEIENMGWAKIYQALPLMREILPHVRKFADEVKLREDQWPLAFCHLSGLLLLHTGDYNGSQQYLEYALAASKKLLGTDNIQTIQILGTIGVSLKRQGKYIESKSYAQKELNLCLENLGEKHLQTAHSHHNLAELFRMLNDYQNAQNHYSKALGIYKKVLGENHMHVADTLRCIGAVYEKEGNYNRAKEYYEQALTIQEEIFDPYHPEIAKTHNDLGLLFRELGAFQYNSHTQYAKAQYHLEQALTISKAILGENHPDTAMNFNNLGYLFEAKGEFETALSYYEKALDIHQKTLGENHPDTAIDLSNIGSILLWQKKYTQAVSYYEKALSIDKIAYGENHLEVAKDLGNLGRASEKLGYYANAEKYFEQSLSIQETMLGENHPDTIVSLMTLCRFKSQQGDLIGAHAYYKRLLSVSELHPNQELPILKVVKDFLNSCIVLNAPQDKQKYRRNYSRTSRNKKKRRKRK